MHSVTTVFSQCFMGQQPTTNTDVDHLAGSSKTAKRSDGQTDRWTAARDKTGKTAFLPGFCKIEQGGGSGGAPPYYGGLTWPVQAHLTNGVAGTDERMKFQ